MSEGVRFRAPWGGFVVGVTLVASFGLLVAAGATMTSRPLIAALLVGVVVLAALLAPRGFVVGHDSLTVERRLLPIEIPLRSIQRVETIEPRRLSGTIRTFGSGGLFGTYGRFWSRKLGHFRMYATRSDGFVLVDAGALFVLTPSTPAAFVAAVESARRAKR